jgi:ACS family tartrate transporter-like MFS transporter
VLSVVFLFYLPDAPATVSWLSAEEKAWIARTLDGDLAAQGREPDPGLKATLFSPLVIGMGLVNLLYLGSAYAFTLSAPILLGGATHLDPTHVGYLVAAGGLLGGLAMLINSWSSDARRERHLHVAIPLIVEGVGYGALSLVHSPLAYGLAYLVAQTAAAAVATVFWLVPSDRLSGRSAAGGVAAINAIGMIGSFLAPFGWGVLHDHTGGYAAGVMVLPFMFFIAAAIVLWLRARARRLAPLAATALPVDV